jgi:addiction module RelE/StbE family toxin
VRIKFSSKFEKQLRKAPKDIQIAAETRLDLFASNPNHPLLRNHKLTGIYKDCRSININGDWRAIYREKDSLLEEPFANFISLGTHSRLYK